MLARLISSMPGFSGLEDTGVSMDEGCYLQSIMPTDQDLGGPTRWALNPRSRMVVPSEPPDIQAARDHLESAWAPYWGSVAGTHVEKSPTNLVRFRYLQELWPDARFIAITRHPFVQSLAVHKWNHSYPKFLPATGAGLTGTLDNWFAAHDNFADDAPHIRQLLVVRYEHLVAEPARELARVASFLGADDVPPFAEVASDRGDRYQRFLSMQFQRSLSKFEPVMANDPPARTAAGRFAFAAAWAVRSRADSIFGRYRRIADSFEARARRHGYTMADPTSVRSPEL